MKGLTHPAVLVLLCLTAFSVSASKAAFGSGPEVKIGSKAFTESVIIGEMIAHLCGDEGLTSAHRRQLGGTRVLWDAL
jgi:osmoprotectant transport system permease protein